jgi:hypothetical protein
MIEAYPSKPVKSNSVIAARVIVGKYFRFAKSCSAVSISSFFRR